MPKLGCSTRLLVIVAAVIAILFFAGLIGGAIGQALDISSPDFLHVPALEIHEFFKGDALFEVGGFSISNTMIASWATIIVVVVFAFAATRKMSIIPRRIQSIVEIGIETLLNFVVGIAGEKNGRRFFPIVATIFLFVMFNAYLALMPFFGPSITITEHEEAHALSDSTVAEVVIGEEIKAHTTGTVTSVKVEQGAKVEEGDIIYILDNHEEIEAEEDGVVVNLELVPGVSVEEGEVICKICEKVEKDEVIYILDNGEEITSPISGHIEHLEASVGDPVTANQSLAAIESKPPLFRSANTDINMTLALAIIAVFFIEFWGLGSRGFRHYIGEYINLGELSRGIKMLFSGKVAAAPMAILIGVINVFMGMLEALSHTIRLVSFAFRLFGNMTAGEMLLLIAVFLVPWIMAVPFYGLELLIGFIQALVFGGLTLVWATMAVAHESEAHE